MNHLVWRVGVRLIEHHTLVTGLLEHRREGHDADGRKAHDPDTTIFRACFSWEGVELWVTNMDQKYSHAVTLTRIPWQEKVIYLDHWRRTKRSQTGRRSNTEAIDREA